MTHSQCSRTALFVCVLSDHQLLSVPLTYMASGLHVLQHNCYMKSFMANKAICLYNRGILNDAWEAHCASCFCAFVARWYANVLQLHTRLKVELDHGRGGAMSRAGCLPSESSGSKVHVQPTVTAIFNRFTR